MGSSQSNLQFAKEKEIISISIDSPLIMYIPEILDNVLEKIHTKLTSRSEPVCKNQSETPSKQEETSWKIFATIYSTRTRVLKKVKAFPVKNIHLLVNAESSVYICFFIAKSFQEFDRHVSDWWNRFEQEEKAHFNKIPTSPVKNSSNLNIDLSPVVRNRSSAISQPTVHMSDIAPLLYSQFHQGDAPTCFQIGEVVLPLLYIFKSFGSGLSKTWFNMVANFIETNHSDYFINTARDLNTNRQIPANTKSTLEESIADVQSRSILSQFENGIYTVSHDIWCPKVCISISDCEHSDFMATSDFIDLMSIAKRNNINHGKSVFTGLCVQEDRREVGNDSIHSRYKNRQLFASSNIGDIHDDDFLTSLKTNLDLKNQQLTDMFNALESSVENQRNSFSRDKLDSARHAINTMEKTLLNHLPESTSC